MTDAERNRLEEASPRPVPGPKGDAAVPAPRRRQVRATA